MTSKLVGLQGQDIDAQAINDLVELAPEQLTPEVVRAAIEGRNLVTVRYETRVVETFEPSEQWRDGYTKGELVVILGRKTKAALENAVGVRSRTKGKILTALGDLTKDELAEVLGFINPTPPRTEEVEIVEEVAPVFDSLNPTTEFTAALAQGIDYGDTNKKRDGALYPTEIGPFPDVNIALDSFDHWQSKESYASRYLHKLRLLRKNESWYIHIAFWTKQSDKKSRGVKRGARR